MSFLYVYAYPYLSYLSGTLSKGGRVGYDTSELLILAVHVRRPSKSYQRRGDVCE